MFEAGSRLKFSQESDSADRFKKKLPKVVKIKDGRQNNKE